MKSNKYTVPDFLHILKGKHSMYFINEFIRNGRSVNDKPLLMITTECTPTLDELRRNVDNVSNDK